MQAAEPVWIKPLFAAIDARDAEGFAAFLHPDVVLRFANADPAGGRDAAQQLVAGFFTSIAALSHRLDDIWSAADGGTVICRGQVRYTRLDGSELQVPFANVFRTGADGITEYSIYVDASALYA